MPCNLLSLSLGPLSKGQTQSARPHGFVGDRLSAVLSTRNGSQYTAAATETSPPCSCRLYPFISPLRLSPTLLSSPLHHRACFPNPGSGVQDRRPLGPHHGLSQPLSQPWLRLAQKPFPYNFRGSGGYQEPDRWRRPPSSCPHIQWPVQRVRPPFARTQEAGWLCTDVWGIRTRAHTHTQPGPALLSGAPGPAWPQQAEQVDPAQHWAYLWWLQAGPCLGRSPGHSPQEQASVQGTRCKLWQRVLMAELAAATMPHG